MQTFLTEPATMTANDAWAELNVAGARPTVHGIAGHEDPGASCVHLLGDPGLSFLAADLGAALRRALTAWRRAEVGYARTRGLLDDSIDDLPVETVRMAVDAAMALRELERGRS